MKYIFPKQLQSVAALAFIAVLIILQHIVQVPLAVISEWELLHCSQDENYIVENPSVFAVLCGCLLYTSRIPCDFSLAYTIDTDGKEHSIILEKIESNITISIDTILYHLMKYDIRAKSYKYDLSIYDKQITYDEIKPYLPANVLVLGFDVDYDRTVSYTHLDVYKRQIDRCPDVLRQVL